MSYLLKPLQQENLDQLVQLETQSFSSDRISERSFRRLLSRNTAFGCGAFEGELLIGYYLLLFRANSNKARVYSLAVDRHQRGRGVGRALLESAARQAKKRDCQALQLEVATTNQMAIALYESLGFQKSGERKAYYMDGTDALVYVRDLDTLPS